MKFTGPWFGHPLTNQTARQEEAPEFGLQAVLSHVDKYGIFSDAADRRRQFHQST